MKRTGGIFSVVRRRAMRLYVLIALIALGSGSAQAQLASDEVPRTRTITDKQQLDVDMQRSRFRLGPVQFLPGFQVSDAGYNSNVFGHPNNPEGDWTATVNVGTRLILPFGPKVFFFGDAFPGYTWYATHTNLNHFSGAARASTAGYFNRLSFQIDARGSESVVTYHLEQPAPALRRTFGGSGRVDVDLTGRIAFFAGVQAQQVREVQQAAPPPNGLNVTRYDRTDEAVQGGFRYALGSSWNIVPEVQYATSRFVLTPELRNNASLAYLLGISYNRPQLFLRLVGGYREGRSYRGSSFPTYSRGVGSFFFSYFVRPWLEVQGYGGRHVSPSIDAVNPYYYGEDIGGGLNIQVLPRVLLKAVGGTGKQRYSIPVTIEGIEVKRQNKVLSYGGGASVIVFRPVTLTAVVTHKNNDSNVSAARYSILEFKTFLAFSGEFMR